MIGQRRIGQHVQPRPVTSCDDKAGDPHHIAIAGPPHPGNAVFHGEAVLAAVEGQLHPSLSRAAREAGTNGDIGRRERIDHPRAISYEIVGVTAIGREGAGHVEPFAAFLEKAAHRIPEMIINRIAPPIQRPPAAKGLFELDDRGDDFGVKVDGAIATDPDKTRRRRADAFD